MALTGYRAIVNLPYRTGRPRDVANNHFHFMSTSAATVAGDALAITIIVDEWYNTLIPSTGRKTMDHYSEVIDVDACRIRVYDLQDSLPRPPVGERLGFGTTSSSPGFPSETYAIHQIRQKLAAGLDRDRSRGHVEVGPLANNAINYEQSPSLVTVTSTELREQLLNATEQLVTAAGALDLTYCVFSEADAGAEAPTGYTLAQLAAGMHPVEQVRTSPHFGTNRLRGEVEPQDAWTDVP